MEVPREPHSVSLKGNTKSPAFSLVCLSMPLDDIQSCGMLKIANIGILLTLRSLSRPSLAQNFSLPLQSVPSNVHEDRALDMPDTDLSDSLLKPIVCTITAVYFARGETNKDLPGSLPSRQLLDLRMWGKPSRVRCVPTMSFPKAPNASLLGSRSRQKCKHHLERFPWTWRILMKMVWKIN